MRNGNGAHGGLIADANWGGGAAPVHSLLLRCSSRRVAAPVSVSCLTAGGRLPVLGPGCCGPAVLRGGTQPPSRRSSPVCRSRAEEQGERINARIQMFASTRL